MTSAILLGASALGGGGGTAGDVDPAAVPKSLFDANTVLTANVDDTPLALTMAASTILARLAAGNIKAATPAELKTLLAVVAADVSDFDTAVATTALLKSAITFVRKTADEGPIASNTTLQDDDHLGLALAINSTYIFDCYVIYDASTAGDIKLAFTVPAGATINWTNFGLATGTAGTAGQVTGTVTTGSGTSQGIGGVGAGTKVASRARGIVRTGATAGTLQLQWAQNTSDATGSNVFTDSFLAMQKVA